MGAPTLFYIREIYIGCPSPIFLEETLGTTLRSNSLDHQLQNIIKCAFYGPPFWFIYMGLNWGAIRNILRTWGTSWEHDGNTLGTREPPVHHEGIDSWWRANAFPLVSRSLVNQDYNLSFCFHYLFTNNPVTLTVHQVISCYHQNGHSWHVLFMFGFQF
jgi:hypothetical protein